MKKRKIRPRKGEYYVEVITDVGSFWDETIMRIAKVEMRKFHSTLSKLADLERIELEAE